MKKIVIFFVIFLLTGLILHHPNLYSEPDGETIFNSKCGTCHTSGGSAPVFAPVKYASIQWERFFKRNKHKRKKDISNIISAQELALIKKYLINHAADSDRPIAAGLK